MADIVTSVPMVPLEPPITIPSMPLQPAEPIPTTFEEMYDFFLAGITDDMFMEMTEEDTREMLEEILLAAIPHFEFPRHDLMMLNLRDKSFTCRLDLEEMMILRQYMIVEWLSFQLASIENVRQKYSSSDFKFTSQASHMDKLTKLKQHYTEQGFHLQRLYCRRERQEGVSGFASTMYKLRETSKR